MSSTSPSPNGLTSSLGRIIRSHFSSSFALLPPLLSYRPLEQEGYQACFLCNADLKDLTHYGWLHAGMDSWMFITSFLLPACRRTCLEVEREGNRVPPLAFARAISLPLAFVSQFISLTTDSLLSPRNLASRASFAPAISFPGVSSRVYHSSHFLPRVVRDLLVTH